jgi:hypothetical protein
MRTPHIPRTLEGEMRQVLAEMSLVQYGPTQSFSKSSANTDRDLRPAGEATPLTEHWHAEWVRDPCENTVLMARAELDAWKRSAHIETDDSTLEDWVIHDGEGYAVAQVAGKFSLAEARVRRIRLKAGRESEFGLPTTFGRHRDDSLARVLNLHLQGCTLRQIEMQTGVSKSKAQRWLKEAA